jgi:hypothetical protein
MGSLQELSKLREKNKIKKEQRYHGFKSGNQGIEKVTCFGENFKNKIFLLKSRQKVVTQDAPYSQQSAAT